MMRKTIPLLFFLCCCKGPPSLAKASSARRCQKLLRSQKMREALSCIWTVYRATGNPRQLRNVALFYEKAANGAQLPQKTHYYRERAVSIYRHYLRSVKLDRFDHLELTARVAKIEQKIPYSILTIVTLPPQATLSLKGFRYKQLKLRSPHTFPRLRPGRYTITLHKKGFRHQVRPIKLKDGQKLVRLFSLQPTPTSQATSRATSPPKILWGTWTSLGATALLLAGAVTTGTLAYTTWTRSLHTAQVSGQERFLWATPYDQAHQLQTSAVVLSIGAGLAAAATVFFFLWERPQTPTSPAPPPPPPTTAPLSSTPKNNKPQAPSPGERP